MKKDLDTPWKPGDTWAPSFISGDKNAGDLWAVGIHIGPHNQAVECYGRTETEANQRRDFILNACNNRDDLITELKALITLCESHGLNAFYARAVLEKAEAA